MTTFEIGNTYSCFSVCDTNCVWSYKVIARTKSTITLQDENNEVKKCRVSKKLSEFCGTECVYPLGNYSMAPILRAKF